MFLHSLNIQSTVKKDTIFLKRIIPFQKGIIVNTNDEILQYRVIKFSDKDKFI